MKKITLFLVAILFAQISYSQKKGKGKADQHRKNQSHQNHKMDKKMLRHVVLFKFKDSATADDIKKVEDAFRDLPSKISQIAGYEWGMNNSPENLNQGFTHCFFLSFKSEEDRAIYLPHPDHKAFGAVLGPFLDKVLVVDYWVTE